jgi:hypothetical protein
MGEPVNVVVGATTSQFDQAMDRVKAKLTEVGDVSERRAERGLGRAAHAMISTGGSADSLASSVEILARTFNVGLGVGVVAAVAVGLFEKWSKHLESINEIGKKVSEGLHGMAGGAEGAAHSV